MEKNTGKCWIPNGKIEEKRKIVWMVGEWDSNTGLFGGKTRTIAIEPRKHSSMILLFYLYQVRTWIILDKTIISFIAQRFDVIKNIVRIF